MTTQTEKMIAIAEAMGLEEFMPGYNEGVMWCVGQKVVSDPITFAQYALAWVMSNGMWYSIDSERERIRIVNELHVLSFADIEDMTHPNSVASAAIDVVYEVVIR